MVLSSFLLAQSTGAVEYTDCTSTEGKTPPQRVSWYDTKQSDGEVLGMRSTPLLPSLPGPLKPRVVSWVYCFLHLNSVFMLNWIV